MDLSQGFFLPASHEGVQLVWLELPVVDEPASVLVPVPSAGDQGVVVELVEVWWCPPGQGLSQR